MTKRKKINSVVKQVLEILILTALMIFIAGMDFWEYLVTGVIP